MLTASRLMVGRPDCIDAESFFRPAVSFPDRVLFHPTAELPTSASSKIPDPPVDPESSRYHGPLVELPALPASTCNERFTKP